MKRILLTLTVFVAGLSVIAPDINAQDNSRAAARQERMDKWHQEMAQFRAKSEQDRELRELADSLAGVQAFAAVRNQDFVLEADQVTFRNGMTTFVNSNTNFISVKGKRDSRQCVVCEDPPLCHGVRRGGNRRRRQNER